MKNILKYIPGFRSKKKWKMIVAIIYYLIFLSIAFIDISGFIIMISLPFIIFNLISLFKKRDKQTIIIAGTCILLLVFGVVSIKKYTMSNVCVCQQKSCAFGPRKVVHLCQHLILECLVLGAPM